MHEHDDLVFSGKKPGSTTEQETGLSRAEQSAVAGRRLDALGPTGMAALQRAAGNAGVTGMIEDDAGESVRQTISSGGSALDDETRTNMESQIGADFSSVRVHTGPTAQRSAEAVSARAYTVGENVVLGNSVDTSSDSGQRTLAHELTHVVQQRNGPVDGTSTDAGVKVSDPSDRFEREAEDTADAVMAGNGPGIQRQREEAAASGGPTLQRAEPGGEDEEIQMQREAGGEEEELQAQRQGPEEDEDVQTQREAGGEDEEMQMQREPGGEDEEMQMQREPGGEDEEMQMQREAGGEEEELQAQRQSPEEDEDVQTQREGEEEDADSATA